MIETTFVLPGQKLILEGTVFWNEGNTVVVRITDQLSGQRLTVKGYVLSSVKVEQ